MCVCVSLVLVICMPACGCQSVIYVCEIYLDKYYLHEKSYHEIFRSLKDVTTDNNNEEDNIFVEPVTSLPDIFELYYYANVSNSVFVLESAIGEFLSTAIVRAWL